jgi:MFS transporter, DHA1 family, tetracycline resistance protein
MKNKILFSLFIIVFLDLLGLGIVLPILAPLIMDSSHNLLPQETSEMVRGITLGLLFAIYPLTQFFGAPILGALSDHVGRKKILIISLIGTIIGYILFAIGIIYRDIYLLFFSRAIDGFTGGNISVAQSAIADLSTNENKSRNFGIIGMSFGLGFILGPFFGGILSDSTIISWFDFDTPFWFAAIVVTLSLILLITTFKETIKEPKKTKIDPFTGIKNIKKAFLLPKLKVMFCISFLVIFGFSFFTQFFPVFLISKFNMSQAAIGNIFAYVGLWSAIGQGLILRPLSRNHQPSKILSFSMLILFFALLAIMIPNTYIGLLIVLPFLAVSRGLTQPNYMALISNMTDKEKQGEILGINQSITALGQTIPPLIAGFLIAININLPIIAAAVSVFLGWLVFIFSFYNKTEPQKSEKKSIII